MNAGSGTTVQGHSSSVDGCDGYCCLYKKKRDSGENSVATSRISMSAAQESSHAVSTSHIVTNSSASPRFGNSYLTWEETVSAPTLPVRCKDTNAELYKNKLGSGNKGKCIKSGSEWFTPTEYMAKCGVVGSRDWKRSIRVGQYTIRDLTKMGWVAPHASSCICSNCLADPTGTGPVRLFTPYQRKRKSQSDDNLKQTKLESITSKDSNTDESSDVCTFGPSIVTGPNPITQVLKKVNKMSSLPVSNDDAWKVLEEEVDSLVNAAVACKSVVEEMKRTMMDRHMTEKLRSKLDNVRKLYSKEVENPGSFTGMKTNAAEASKCDNCGREGSLECSGCYAVRYCSSFCQRHDWPNHQGVCQDRGKQPNEEML